MEEAPHVALRCALVEQVTHAGDTAFEHLERTIRGSQRQRGTDIGFNGVGAPDPGFHGQVSSILDGCDQLLPSSSTDEMFSQMIPQVGLTGRQVCPSCQSIGVKKLSMQRHQLLCTYVLLQIRPDHIMQADGPVYKIKA